MIPQALAIRAQIAIDRQEQDRAERLLASGKAGDAATGPASWQDGALETRCCSRPSITSGSRSRPTPTIAKPCSGWSVRSSSRTTTKAAEPFRELAGNLERLNTLVHRAANPTARKDPGLLRELGDACAALHRDPEARAWYELAIARDPLDSASQRALYRLREPDRSTGPTPRLLPEPGSQLVLTP